jgi:phosphoribosyl-ATP pyrophosphohydrolase/phosphoribosyl-AMP cyclohydrolase
MIDLKALDFDKGGGTVTVVTQDSVTGRVLMVAAADREALEQCVATGEMHYRSRSRGLWRKGATSGNIQRIESLTADCDGDAVLARVVPAGPACHTGVVSCFTDSAPGALGALAETIASRASAPDPKSYTKRLLSDENLRLKKLGEESAELIAACARGNRESAVAECADLFYHSLVALAALGASIADVERELARRAVSS